VRHRVLPTAFLALVAKADFNALRKSQSVRISVTRETKDRLARRLPLRLALFFLAIAPAVSQTSSPTPFNTETSAQPALSASIAASRSVLPEGFQMSVFAEEPEIRQPIAMTTDPRGRLWVAENDSYSESSVGFHPQLRDRILIFEDTDQDGRHNSRKVFWDGAERLTSVEVGLGGVWAICLPNLVFIPDANHDDIPDGPPQILLDGFEFKNARHTVANGLRWGPDGWLYGRQGILGTSLVGAPGTPENQRTRFNVGIWRFHPTRRAFEIVAQGTTNPWGMDWDARGEAFFINTVIGHLWHVIPGAHYRRMFGDDPTPFVYELIEQHADHVHWATTEVWTDVRKGVTDATLAAGGGHAHTGLLIYQGGQWPEAWNGKLLTINFHGRRLNVERLERTGSGFVGRREPDQFLFADPWFRGIDLIAAPDGGVFVSDWNDTGECHDHDGIHRTSGRIYHIRFGPKPPGPPTDLTRLDAITLAQHQSNPNDWLARQSRRVLADRFSAGLDLQAAHAVLRTLADSGPDEVSRLRAVWALHVSGASPEVLLHRHLGNRPTTTPLPTEAQRAWAIRLLEDSRSSSTNSATHFDALVTQTLPQLARTESSGLVRLTLASLLQKIPIALRNPLASALLSRPEDAEDPNLPLMLWYGIEPLVAADPGFVSHLVQGRIPRTQRLAARRIGETYDVRPDPLNTLLSALASPTPLATRKALLDGVAEAFAGRRRIPKPAAWDAIQSNLAEHADEPLRDRIRDLSGLFGDGRALDAIRVMALSRDADLPRRRAALQSLIEGRSPELRAVCETLLPVRDLSGTAASGLSLFDDPALADRLIAEWPNLYGHERAPVMNAILSRPEWVSRLLESMAAGRFQRSHLGAYQVRQIQAFNRPELTRRLSEVWGTVQATDNDAQKANLARWKHRLTPEALQGADLLRGKAAFQEVCANCHRLYGEGASIGPDLTGAGRDNVEYLLENLLFPSSIVPADFRQTTLSMKDGRTLSGVVRSRSNRTVTLQPIGDPMTLDTADIAEEQPSVLSLMPDGLLEALPEARAIDLLAYLLRKDPLPVSSTR